MPTRTRNYIRYHSRPSTTVRDWLHRIPVINIHCSSSPFRRLGNHLNTISYETRYTFHTVLLIALLLGGLFHFSACTSDSKRAETQISVSTPPRPAGQTDVVGLTCEPIETVRIGFIGLGARGTEAIRRFTYQKGIQVKALCDLNQFRVDSCQNMLSRANMPEATTYYGSEDVWKQVCERDDIDLIYIATDWIHHAPMMIYAMEHGKHVACEVPAAMTLDEIWKVIDTAERTRKHCMMLENCVYDFFEITTLNMAQQGLFGNITHVKGAYNHCLYDIWPDYNADWRMQYNMAHRGDVYPTHGMGPACQLLDIHRGRPYEVSGGHGQRSRFPSRLPG